MLVSFTLSYQIVILSCSDEEYEFSVTLSTWPSNQYWVSQANFYWQASIKPHFKSDLALSMGYDVADLQQDVIRDLIKAEIQEDFLKVDVYFETLNVRRIVETKKYTVRDVIT